MVCTAPVVHRAEWSPLWSHSCPCCLALRLRPLLLGMGSHDWEHWEHLAAGGHVGGAGVGMTAADELAVQGAA
jgi:hypothetical protein